MKIFYIVILLILALIILVASYIALNQNNQPDVFFFERDSIMYRGVTYVRKPVIDTSRHYILWLGRNSLKDTSINWNKNTFHLIQKFDSFCKVLELQKSVKKK